MRARIAAEGLPILGLHLVIGPTALERVGRLIGCVGSGIAAPIEMVAETA